MECVKEHQRAVEANVTAEGGNDEGCSDDAPAGKVPTRIGAVVLRHNTKCRAAMPTFGARDHDRSSVRRLIVVAEIGPCPLLQSLAMRAATVLDFAEPDRARLMSSVHGGHESGGSSGRCRNRGSDQPYWRAAALVSRPHAKPRPRASSRDAPATVRTTQITDPARAAEA